MKEQAEDLEEQAFIPMTPEQMSKYQARLERIREVSAEMIAFWAQAIGNEAAGAASNSIGEVMAEKANVTLPGKVQKVIQRPHEPKKAEISVQNAEPLYKEIRIENTLNDAHGNRVELKPGVEVDVKIEAEPDAIKPTETERSSKPS